MLKKFLCDFEVNLRIFEISNLRKNYQILSQLLAEYQLYNFSLAILYKVLVWLVIFFWCLSVCAYLWILVLSRFLYWWCGRTNFSPLSGLDVLYYFMYGKMYLMSLNCTIIFVLIMAVKISCKCLICINLIIKKYILLLWEIGSGIWFSIYLYWFFKDIIPDH